MSWGEGWVQGGSNIICWNSNMDWFFFFGYICEVKVQLIPKISEPERNVEVNVTWMFMLGGSSQEGKWLGSPPFISHGKVIWIGKVALLRGRKQSPWLLTTYASGSPSSKYWGTLPNFERPLVEEILLQLRLVLYPIIYMVLYIPGGCLGISSINRMLPIIPVSQRLRSWLYLSFCMENCHGSLGFGFLVIFFMDSTMVNNFFPSIRSKSKIITKG